MINMTLETFSNVYEKYFQNKTISDTFNVLNQSSVLFNTINSIIHLIDYILDVHSKSRTIPEDFKSLSIELTSEYDYDTFILKLNSINKIYTELCNLLSISINDYPLQIIKVESGSLLAKIFGESKIVDLIVHLIKEFTGYIYRNFTQEGKILSIPRKVESIESIINLSKKLQEIGIDIEPLKQDLQKSTLEITHDLSKLVQCESTVKINEDILSIGDEYRTKFLVESRRLLIEKNK